MRTLVSLLVGTYMLNMSVHAGSPTRTSDTDGPKTLNENVQKKQKMETRPESGTSPGLEKNPKPYRPESTEQERIKTKD